MQYGDEWDQERTAEGRQQSAGWSRRNAEDFVKREWAPSMVLTGEKIFGPSTMAEAFEDKK